MNELSRLIEKFVPRISVSFTRRFGFTNAEAEEHKIRMFICHMKHVVHVKETSCIQERAKALEVVHHINDTFHDGKCAKKLFQFNGSNGGSDSPQKPVSTPSVHKDVGITRSALYCFKVVVNDGKTTTPITCFSDQPNTLTRDVNEVLAELAYKDPYTLPPFLKQPEGVTHTFQFYFDTMVTARRPDLVLDKVFPNPTLALPPPMTTSSANNSVFRGFFEKQKLTGPNFIDCMGKTVNELHAMLKLHEQTLPKTTLLLFMLRADKVQKVNKHKKSQSQMATRGQNHGKGKNKQAYAPKPKIPPPPKREDPANDSICHECGETGHWKRNCPRYLAELLKKKKNAASGAGGLGIFVIELNTILNRSWIYDTGCGTHICNTTHGSKGK
nr:zinc finger, CCHC-type [Tanacetum cinerariifolium]